MNLRFEKYDEKTHLSQVVELERGLWNNMDSQMLTKVFKWKYPSNSEICNAFVALDGTKVIGFRGFNINNYIFRNQIFPVAVFSDAIISSEYQRKGIGTSLANYAFSYYQTTSLKYFLALSSNEKSSSIYLNKFHSKAFAHKQIRIGISFCNIFKILKKSQVIHQNNYNLVHYSRQLEDEIVNRLVDFCKTLSSSEHIEMARDEKYWKWKYSNPLWKVHYLILYRQNKICGFASFIETTKRKIKLTQILDLMATSEYERLFLVKGVKKFCNTILLSIQTSSNSYNNTKDMRKEFPFLRKSNLKNPADFLYIKNISEDKSLENISWNLNYISVD